MKKQYRTPLVYLLVSAAALIFLFVSTSPDAIPPVLLVAVFAVLYVFLVAGTYSVLLLIRALGGFAWKESSLKRLAIALALAPTFLLLLQSIGQLTIQDILLTAGFGAIAYFYYRRFFYKASPDN